MTPSHEWYSPVTPSDVFAPASCPAPRSLPLIGHSGTYAYTRPSSSPPSEAHPYHPRHYFTLNTTGGSSSSMVYAPSQVDAPWSHTSLTGPLPTYPFPVYDYDYDSTPMPLSSPSASLTNSTHSTSASVPQFHSTQYSQNVGMISAAEAYPRTLYP